MSDLSPETQLKIASIMEEIKDSDLDIDTKEFYSQKILQAKACANGSKDKIDDMSKVLLNQTIFQIRTELRLKKNVSEIVEGSLSNCEEKICKKFENLLSEKFEELKSMFAEHVKTKHAEDNQDKENEKERIANLSIKDRLVLKIMEQPFMSIVFVAYIIFEKIGWDNVGKMFTLF